MRIIVTLLTSCVVLIYAHSLCSTVILNSSDTNQITDNAIDSATQTTYCAFDGITGKLLLDWLTQHFNIEIINPTLQQPSQQATQFLESKFTFHTQTAVTKKEIWEICTHFLSFFDLCFMPLDKEKSYILAQKALVMNQNKNLMKTYVNTDAKIIIENDEPIRYIYFLKNLKIDMVKGLIDHCKSSNAIVHYLEKLNALTITDTGNNIKLLIEVLHTLDIKSTHDMLSVVKLNNVNAEDIITTYHKLVPHKSNRIITQFNQEKQKAYFSDNINLIAEPRLNMLIIVGPTAEVKKVEDLVINHLDIIPSLEEQTVKVYNLRHLLAKEAVPILKQILETSRNSATQKEESEDIQLAAEEDTNTILATGSQKNIDRLTQILQEIDIQQPQIAVNILLLSIRQQSNREIGTQIRNKDRHTISKNVDFQASGLPLLSGGAEPLVENNSLMANLISLATFQEPGALLLSITNPANGVWALFKLLQNYTDTSIISNPFLIATHKKESSLVVGETRRPITNTFTISGANPAFADLNANLTIKIVPRINSLGLVQMDVVIISETFTDTTDPLSANKTIRSIYTNATLGNNQVLAIAGISRNQNVLAKTKVPILGDLPLVGFWFSNKSYVNVKDNIIAFISVTVLDSNNLKKNLTKEKISEVYEEIDEETSEVKKRDPIHRYFFKDTVKNNSRQLDDFINESNIKVTEFNQHSENVQEQCVQYNKKSVLIPCEDMKKANE